MTCPVCGSQDWNLAAHVNEDGATVQWCGDCSHTSPEPDRCYCGSDHRTSEATR